MSHASRSAQFQVEHNQESSRRQYALGDKARHLGWREVETIDEDMGCSGSGSEKRSGFERMVAAVGMGQVGAVFSIEASRLARNNRDWHQLVDICGMVGTLIIDEDGIYDATILNDRLLLGLKGTMSEFELAMIRQRMHAGLLQKARRGELLLKMAIGYMSTKDERCEKDPDERVRAAIELVFNKFGQTGSARQTLLWFRQEGVELPSTVYGAQGRAVEWRTPVYTTILNIITKAHLCRRVCVWQSRDRNMCGKWAYSQEAEEAQCRTCARAVAGIDQGSSRRIYYLAGVRGQSVPGIRPRKIKFPISGIDDPTCDAVLAKKRKTM